MSVQLDEVDVILIEVEDDESVVIEVGVPGPPGVVDRDTVGSFVEDHLILHPPTVDRIDGGVFT